ncbi:MAG: penicillin-binding protein activator LpoB [Gemmatimonadetes bacterium]|nr:penicillin-binding protein activator LpoB [Gemmatimonadota bacterium]
MPLAALRAPVPRRAFAVALLALAAACNSTRVSRVDPNAVTDLSGRWNDADSRLVANALIQQSLDAPWARNYATANGGKQPAVIIGAFRNRSMEHIPVGTFTRDLERAFVNSGSVQIVASKEERGEIRDERADQQQNATAETRARMAREQGARYMLQGDVQTIEDSEGKEKIVYYQIDATLIDLESNAKVWIGQHKIKKYIERRGIGL